MENRNMWIIYALLAALFWGMYAIAAKIISTSGYNIPSNISFFLIFAGIGIVAIVYFLFSAKNFDWKVKILGILIFIVLLGYINLIIKKSIPETPLHIIAIGILSGILWGLGQMMGLFAFQNGGIASKAVPIFNSNTLIVVIVGIIFLKEAPATNMAEWIKFVTGIIGIILGGILLSK